MKLAGMDKIFNSLTGLVNVIVNGNDKEVVKSLDSHLKNVDSMVKSGELKGKDKKWALNHSEKIVKELGRIQNGNLNMRKRASILVLFGIAVSGVHVVSNSNIGERIIKRLKTEQPKALETFKEKLRKEENSEGQENTA